MSCRQHGYPWPSLATPPYRSSLLVGPHGYIPYPHRAAVCRFVLVALLLVGYVRGSIGENHLWARPSFSSSLLHVWFVFDSFHDGRLVAVQLALRGVLPPRLIQLKAWIIINFFGSTQEFGRNWIQILDELAFQFNALEKGMNPYFHLTSAGS